MLLNIHISIQYPHIQISYHLHYGSYRTCDQKPPGLFLRMTFCSLKHFKGLGCRSETPACCTNHKSTCHKNVCNTANGVTSHYGRLIHQSDRSLPLHVHDLATPRSFTTGRVLEVFDHTSCISNYFHTCIIFLSACDVIETLHTPLS